MLPWIHYRFFAFASLPFCCLNKHTHATKKWGAPLSNPPTQNVLFLKCATLRKPDADKRQSIFVSPSKKVSDEWLNEEEEEEEEYQEACWRRRESFFFHESYISITANTSTARGEGEGGEGGVGKEGGG